MQIYWDKGKRLHKKRVQLPKDFLGTSTWPPSHCFGTPIWPPWRHVKTLNSSDVVPFLRLVPRGYSSYLFGVNKFTWIGTPVRVLKPKMTADTLYEDKDLWQYFQKVLRRKCSKVIFITMKICSTGWLCNFLLLNWYLLGVEMNLGHAHTTRFWFDSWRNLLFCAARKHKL